MFTDDEGRLVFAMDQRRGGTAPDGLIDRYFWYKSKAPFRLNSTLLLSDATVYQYGQTLGVVFGDTGLLLEMVFADPPSRSEPAEPPPSTSGAAAYQARLNRDRSILDEVTSSLADRVATNRDSANTTTYELTGGYEIGQRHDGTRKLRIEDVEQTRDWHVSPSSGLESEETVGVHGASEDCDSGGPGARSCSCAPEGGTDGCSVTCQDGFYACCNCPFFFRPECKCVEIEEDDECTEPGSEGCGPFTPPNPITLPNAGEN